MTRLDPMPRGDLPEREPLFELVEASMGFRPTSLRVMAAGPTCSTPSPDRRPRSSPRVRCRRSEHWNDDEILHALAVVSLFGYLNRFNAAVATTLEPEPLEAARRHLPRAAGQRRPRALTDPHVTRRSSRMRGPRPERP